MMAGNDRDRERPDQPRAAREWPREPPLLDRVPEEELRRFLEQHEEWLDTHGRSGKRADLHQTNLSGLPLSGRRLSRANLRGASLRKADLRGADLSRADLSDADLSDADLQGADLSEANLQEAELRGAKLCNAVLQDADLTGAVGLLAERLAGAKVCGAQLPEAIGGFEGLEHVAEASRNTGKLFVAMLLGCAYAGLTIGATTDAELLTGSSSSKLPIIDTMTPIVGFYALAPLLLLGLSVYFCLSLQQLWEGLIDLPAVFPDGRPLHKTAYPWLLNGIVRAHFPLLKRERTFLSRVQQAVCSFAVWCVVPLTLLACWARALRRHDWLLTQWQIGLIGLAIGFGLAFGILARDTLQGRFREGTHQKGRAVPKLALQWGGVSLAVVLVTVIFALFSWGAIEGVPPGCPSPGAPGAVTRPDVSTRDLRRWVPGRLAGLGLSPFANLHKAEVSARPENWTGETKAAAQRTKGGNLEGRDLCYAVADHAFLVHANLVSARISAADLHEAMLQGAELQKADLQGARLQRADLRWADLSEAVLGGASFQQADLRGATLRKVNPQAQTTPIEPVDLHQADLTGADLGEASLQAADLHFAELRGAKLANTYLQEANLERANLRQAHLPGADLRRANGEHAIFRQADLRSANLQKADLGNANLEEARLKGAELQGATLGSARLRRADLTLTRLQQADLAGADLCGARLPGAQLQKAVLVTTKLRGSDLRGSSLRGADLAGAVLQGADLRGADLRGAVGLTQQQVDSAITDGTTAVSPPLWAGRRERRAR
jgi:uncharacterized protein YjbI with pentapeptide repeats